MVLHPVYGAVPCLPSLGCSSTQRPHAHHRTRCPRPAVGGIGEAELAFGGNMELSTDMQALFRTRWGAPAHACMLPALLTRREGKEPEALVRCLALGNTGLRAAAAAPWAHAHTH